MYFFLTYIVLYGFFTQDWNRKKKKVQTLTTDEDNNKLALSPKVKNVFFIFRWYLPYVIVQLKLAIKISNSVTYDNTNNGFINVFGRLELKKKQNVYRVRFLFLRVLNLVFNYNIQ